MLFRSTVASTPATPDQPARVLDVAAGRDARAGQAVLAFAQAHGAPIEQAVMDMSPAYRNAAAPALPQAVVIFDWFHVMAQAGAAVDAGRRREMATAGALLKNTRYRWLTRGEHLSAARQEQQQRLTRSGLAAAGSPAGSRGATLGRGRAGLALVVWLGPAPPDPRTQEAGRNHPGPLGRHRGLPADTGDQIGRASCRERVYSSV